MIVFSAPSGSGKTTLVKHLLNIFSVLEFSISATSRSPRGKEVNGKDYHFLNTESFKKEISNNSFIEYEEVYPGTYYGTLRSEIEKIWNNNKIVVFDIDVIGGLNIKEQFSKNTLTIFIKPPDFETLEKRLIKRKTDNSEKIKIRLEKAKEEMTLCDKFDHLVINDDLEIAKIKIKKIVSEFISKK
ncbi:MAG: guanylate kinase [Flavobacteriaceae bacterium]|nr:guanylate kinase [Flavobacteriaceae bacterium]